MNNFISGIYIGGEVCDALGLDASKVKQIEIIIGTDKPVQVNVIQFMYAKEAHDFTEVLSKFNLVPKEEEK